ncbi:MAG: Zn-ribbon domain-containing OB-fold protein [Desulfosarcinaceae bacterium]
MGNKKEADLRFEKFGTVSFTATTKINDFIDYLEKGKVMGTRCKACGQVFFPPRADCCQCFASDMEWFEVTGSGTLATYTHLAYAPVGFEQDLPYSLAVLDYGDYRVFGRLAADVDMDSLRVGQKMQTVINQLPNGRLNYVFKPV